MGIKSFKITVLDLMTNMVVKSANDMSLTKHNIDLNLDILDKIITCI